jgi:toxin ParE1/3/4
VTRAVILSPAAEAELDEALDWYDMHQPGLGQRLAQHVDAVFQRISVSPGLYPEVFRDVRRATLSRFPYSVFYRVEQNQIFVLAVFHGSRDPAEWIGRA